MIIINIDYVIKFKEKDNNDDNDNDDNNNNSDNGNNYGNHIYISIISSNTCSMYICIKKRQNNNNNHGNKKCLLFLYKCVYYIMC